jgi:hypothetical protein
MLDLSWSIDSFCLRSKKGQQVQAGFLAFPSANGLWLLVFEYEQGHVSHYLLGATCLLLEDPNEVHLCFFRHLPPPCPASHPGRPSTSVGWYAQMTVTALRPFLDHQWKLMEKNWRGGVGCPCGSSQRVCAVRLHLTFSDSSQLSLLACFVMAPITKEETVHVSFHSWTLSLFGIYFTC